jgi:hypothetical protein
MMIEERSLKRKNLIYYLNVIDIDTGLAIGRVLDLTAEGIMTFSETTVGSNQIFNLIIHLPVEVVSKKEIVLVAESLHCKKDSVSGLYHTGFKIIDIDKSNKMNLLRSINRFGFKD